MAIQDLPIRWEGPDAVIGMPPEIDVTNADSVRLVLLAALNHRAPTLIIDLSGTTFCDSAGVHAIIAVHKQAAAEGTQVRLVVTALLRIFTLAGVDQIIPTYPTLAEAVAATAAELQ